MTPCLGPEEFVDLLDGTLPPPRRQHVEGCATCRATAGEMREALALAVADEVPEPSTLFWSSINARVRAEIEARPMVSWRRWLRWELVVPMGAVAALVVAAVVSNGRPEKSPVTPVSPTVAVAAPDAVPSIDAVDEAARDSDAALSLVVDLSRTLPDGGWDTLGMTTLPDLADAAQVLSAEERSALADLLRTAVDRPKS